MDHPSRASCALTCFDLSYGPKAAPLHPAAPERGEGDAKCWQNPGGCGSSRVAPPALCPFFLEYLGLEKR